MHAVALSFVFFFCVLAAYYVMRPVREQLSAAVGSTQLPWFYAATFVATLALTPVFAALVSRWPRPVVVPLVYGFFIACLLGFVPLFTVHGLLSPRALGIVFFVWVSVFNLFVVSVFWSFMADIWDQQQARRLFPIIALGGTAGAIAGPLITRGLVEVIGVAPLLMVSAALRGMAIVCVIWLGRWSRVHGARREARHEAAVGGGMFDGLKQVFADPFMRSMALLMVLGDCIGTINYALVTDYSGAVFHDAVARTPSSMRPPIGASPGGSPRRGWARAQRPSMTMQATVPATSSADTTSSPWIPRTGTSDEAASGPAIAPLLPPAAIAP